MRNPRVTAIISAIGIVIIGSAMLFQGPESPSTAVVVLQWLLLAGGVIGLVGSLIQMGSSR